MRSPTQLLLTCTGYWLHIAHVELLWSWMENSVIQHTFLKFDQSQKKTDFQEEPHIKQKKNRSSEKKQ